MSAGLFLCLCQHCGQLTLNELCQFWEMADLGLLVTFYAAKSRASMPKAALSGKSR